MAKCWTCGSEIPEFGFTCPVCTQTKEIVKVRETLETSSIRSFSQATNFLGIELSCQLSEIASVIEWGFEELSWRMEQMIGILKNIDETLKTPSQAQANEWRQIAEELRRRGVLEKAEKFFLKSLEVNPLDYRTYISLGKIYLQMENPEQAKTYFKESLPHAPKGDIDYKSYSYRLIGRIYFCQGDYNQAALTLYNAIKLSPNYYLGYYDYAQYLALLGDKENCLDCLKIAIIKEPIPIDLVREESNFNFFKNEVEDVLKQIEADENIRKEIEHRRKWKQFGLKEHCIGRLIEAQRKIEGEIAYLSSSHDPYLTLFSRLFVPLERFNRWDHTNERYKKVFISIIKEETGLSEVDLFAENKPLYNEVFNIATNLARRELDEAVRADERR